jgi:hypothetical protein
MCNSRSYPIALWQTGAFSPFNGVRPEPPAKSPFAKKRRFAILALRFAVFSQSVALTAYLFRSLCFLKIKTGTGLT